MTIKWESIKKFKDIKYERGLKDAQGVAKITINRPNVRNAFRPKTVFEMGAGGKRSETGKTVFLIYYILWEP